MLRQDEAIFRLRPSTAATKQPPSAGPGPRDLGGAIAQMGERLNGIQEVGGSIPPGSTNDKLH